MKYLAALLLLAACDVTPEQWKRCEFYCKPNKGIKAVTSVGSCYCQNGMQWIK